MFPKSFPMELPSSAPAASEPLWGGRCGGAVDSLANRAAWKKEKGEKNNRKKRKFREFKLEGT